MLRHLHIENIAVVKRADIDIESGFSVMTGETGAGKSVIIDSLKLLSGKRVGREIIRSGEEYAYCEALFDGIDGETAEYFSALSVPPDESEMLICVKVSLDGRITARINGRAVTRSMQRSVCERLISIHGQNESAVLSDESSYISLLDSYARTGELLEEYEKIYNELCELRGKLSSLAADRAGLERERDMLLYQIKEIESAHLKAGEEEALCTELKRIENSERIEKQVRLVDRALHGAEGGGAIYLVKRAQGAMSQLGTVIDEADGLSQRLSDAMYELEDIAERVRSMSVDTDTDPTERIDAIQERLERISKLKRKYGEDTERVLDFCAKARMRLDEIESADDRRCEYSEKIDEIYGRAKLEAARITELRVQAAAEASDRICEVLRYLDMPRVRFEIRVSRQDELGRFGADRVEFLVATNIGEPLMPIRDIASGGELSRIMLALRSVLNQRDNIGCTVYDEVDTGISGSTSRRIGLKLKEISRRGQVICVTHSAQIATLADTHFLITKSEADGRAKTSIRTLDFAERVEEAARILGGINITEAQRQAARDMMNEKEQK